MGLLNRLAIGKSGTAAQAEATRIRNEADADKHDDFNAKLAAEIAAKEAAAKKGK